MVTKAIASMGQAAMRKQQSRAQKVFWPLQSGRPKYFKPRLMEAVDFGRQIANRLHDAVAVAELRRDDAGCFLISAKGGEFARWDAFKTEFPDSSDLEMARDILNSGARPVGIIFYLLDREKGELLIHGRPFEAEDAAIIAVGLDHLELTKRADMAKT